MAISRPEIVRFSKWLGDEWRGVLIPWTRDTIMSNSSYRCASITQPEGYTKWYILTIYPYPPVRNETQVVREKEEVFRLAAQWLLQGLIEEKE